MNILIEIIQIQDFNVEVHFLPNSGKDTFIVGLCQAENYPYNISLREYWLIMICISLCNSFGKLSRISEYLH